MTTGLNLLREKDRIEEFLRRSQSPLSAASFASIFIWQDFFEFHVREIDGNLCVFASHEIGTFLYLPPLGTEISAAAIDESFRIMEEMNQGRPVSRIENVPASQLKYFDRPPFSAVAKFPDYVYRREDIAGLAGVPYKSQRWACNYFAKNYPHEFLPYDPSMSTECLQLYDRWAKERFQRYEDSLYRQMLEDNQTVHRRILQYDRELDLIGRVVRVNGRVAGYSFGHRLNDQTFCILCEVTDLSLKGLSAFIFRECCRDPSLQAFPLINVMDDSGMGNIRRIKLSFRPLDTVPNHVINLKNISTPR